jgi:hypothetical protein
MSEKTKPSSERPLQRRPCVVRAEIDVTDNVYRAIQAKHPNERLMRSHLEAEAQAAVDQRAHNLEAAGELTELEEARQRVRLLEKKLLVESEESGPRVESFPLRPYPQAGSPQAGSPEEA